MIGTTANKALKDDQTEIRSNELNVFLVRGDKCSYKSIKQVVSAILIVTVFSLFFRSPFHGRSLTLYSSLWIILILHLLIIWVVTWVHVLSDAFSGFLWVMVAKTALFRGLFHINAARKVVAVYLMRW